jgi:hypothetical protein
VALVGWEMQELDGGRRAFLIHRTRHTATYVNSHAEAEEWYGYVLADVRLAVVPTLSCASKAQSDKM